MLPSGSNRYTFIRCLVLLILFVFTNTSKGQSTFYNPVIWSDVPDMDAVRVGNDYWMVSTTMHFSPGAPIMHSKDLVHWETVNYIFDTLNDSPKNNLEGGNVYGRGQWAASLKYHKGKFYCFFGTGAKSFLYSTSDPRKKWEIIWQSDIYYHDAAFFIDDDDRPYLFFNGSHIQLREFYPDFRPGFKEDGVSCEVVHGEPRGLLEGSHVYKHDGKYYLTCIWWPQGGIRTQVCFRADRIDGDYANNMKVILSDDAGHRGRGVAQGFLIDTPNGEWWSMMMQDHEAVGRIPYLMPMQWKDGWPMLGNGNGKIDKVLSMPGGGRKCKDRITASDEFSKSQLDVIWQWNHNPDNSLWSLTERKGFMRLKTGKVVSNIFEARNTLTQRCHGPKSGASIRIDISKMKEGDHAGLSTFCAQPGTIEAVVENGQHYLLMTDRTAEKARVAYNSDVVYLRVDADFTTDNATFLYSQDEKEWKPLGNSFHMVFNLEHFVGNRFAIFNYATKQSGGWVDVDWFHFRKD